VCVRFDSVMDFRQQPCGIAAEQFIFGGGDRVWIRRIEYTASNALCHAGDRVTITPTIITA
jgi:hypothetical protein